MLKGWVVGLAVVNGGHGLLTVLGQATPGADPTVSLIVTLANYGTVGILAALLLRGQLVGKNVYEQALKDRDRDHGELVALRQKLEDVIIPGFVRMTDLTQRLIDRERDERRGIMDRSRDERREMLDRDVVERREFDERRGS